MTGLLDEKAVAERLAAYQQNGQTPYEYIEPFSAKADSLLEVLQNVDGRFMLGLSPIDVMTRGFGKHELALVVGFAHAGKTQLINTMILNNPDKRILFFSLDDPAEMILTKLVCMKEGLPAEELEQFVRRDPAEAGELLRRHARHTFKNVLVPDANLGLAAMDKAIDEAEDYWGAYPDAIVIDYLQLIPSEEENADYSNTKSTSLKLKRWIKDVDAPVIVLHQNSRAKGGPGEVISMLSAAYGGEQEGTFMLGVRRKLFDEGLTEAERRRHENSITLHLVKNKRPPGRLTARDGVDFYMDPDTGIIRLWNSQLHEQQTGAQRLAQDQDRKARLADVPLPYKDS